MANVPPIKLLFHWEKQEPDGTECQVCGEVAWGGHWIVWATFPNGHQQPLYNLQTVQTFCACQSCHEELPLPTDTCGSNGSYPHEDESDETKPPTEY